MRMQNISTKFLLFSLFVCLICAQEEASSQNSQVTLYDGEDGGFIECYCNCAETGLYSVGNDIYAIGSIRMQGAYDSNGMFQPKGYENQDISAIDCFKFVCNMAFTGCCGGCWAGGASGTPQPNGEFECHDPPALCNHDTHLP